MKGLRISTDSLSESAATCFTRATVWPLVSGPSSEANTVSFTGPVNFASSFRTACSSCAERDAMTEVYLRGASLGDRGPARRSGRRAPDDLERAAVARGVDARGDERGPCPALCRHQRGLELRLGPGHPRLDAEGARQRRE